MASTAQTDELDAQIKRLELPPDLPGLPSLGLPARLYADTRAHRLLPAELGFALARARARVFWARSEEGRRELISSMDYVVGRSERASEVMDLARQHGYETAKRSEYLWRPWLTSDLAVEGAKEAVEAVRSHGPVLLTFMHHGPYVGLTRAVRDAGIPHYAPINAFYYETPHQGFRGHRDRRHMRSLMDGARCFSASGTVPMMFRILQQGKTLGLAIDVPGSTDASFLGRPVKMASGAATIAHKAGVPVLPLTMHRGPGRTLGRVRFGPLIPSRDFADAESLHAEIVRQHEPAVLEWPEALEWPLERWRPAEADDVARFGFASAS